MTRIDSDLVIIASRNEGKIREFVKLFEPMGIRVQGLDDLEHLPDIQETGTTFAENAVIKAETVSRYVHLPVLADDSGLCVDQLEGAPGVYSARFAGESATDEDNNRKLLSELEEQNAAETIDGLRCLSRAQFICSLVLYEPGKGKTLQVEGSCSGHILDTPRGEHGFGYDPLFYLPSYKKTMAELEPGQKNKISHRAEAIRQLFDRLEP